MKKSTPDLIKQQQINRIADARAILLQLGKTKRSINCVWDEIQMSNPQGILKEKKNLHLKEKSTKTLVKNSVFLERQLNMAFFFLHNKNIGHKVFLFTVDEEK